MYVCMYVYMYVCMASTCASIVSGYLYNVRAGFGDSRGHCSDAHLAHQLHRHRGRRVDLVQVI